MDEHKIAEISVVWRGKQLNVEIDQSCGVKEFGQVLQDLTNVKPDTLRLIVPQSEKKSSRLVNPFSDVDSSLSLRDAGIIQGKSIRMMGVFEDEIEEVSENKRRPDMRIIGFDEEEKWLRQCSSNSRIPVSLKLPQGPYIFGDFQTLHLPGIELNPPPSEALKRMHVLGCDPGIIAIMNKNKGEEISLCLRTDDLKGFRKYEVIKKTLIHELAHMVHSEHDANFFALNKQLTEEAANLDWTKSKGHTLNGHKNSNTYEEEEFLDTVAKPITANKLGGEANPFASPRASSIAAAYQCFITISAGISEQAVHGSEPDPDEKASGPTRSITADLERMETVSEPDPDETLTKSSGHGSEPDPDEKAFGLTTSVTADLERVATVSEPDPDETLTEMNFTLSDEAERTVDNPEKVTIPLAGEDLVTKEVVMDLDEMNLMEPDPDDMAAVTKYQTKVDQGSHREQHSSSEPDPDDRIDSLLSEDLQRIEEPVAEICSRLQKTVQMLRSEANPVEVPTVLQTLPKIIRNVIEHPDNVKFRKLRKANPQFQRNVANYTAAMEVLKMVGFTEDVIADEIGRLETYMVLKRNDPGLLWLAKSSLEVIMV